MKKGSVIKMIAKCGVWIFSGICWLWIFGCSEPTQITESEYILRTSVVSVSREYFSEELDLKQSAYSYNIKKNPDEFNEMVIDLVNAISEEIVLLSEAAEKQIQISDQQLDQAEAEFKKDYPDNSFEQMLLKNAISYSFWKQRFKKNMIIEKLIDQELSQKIEIASQDIVDFYQKYDKGKFEQSDEKDEPAIRFQDEKQLVSRLRMQKTQDSYQAWIRQLWGKYPVDINKEKLKTFLIDIEASKDAEQ